MVAEVEMCVCDVGVTILGRGWGRVRKVTGCGLVWGLFLFSLCAVRQVGGGWEKGWGRERRWGDVEVWENGETFVLFCIIN